VFARVSTYQGDPAQIDQGLDYARENILPRVKQVDGFEGVYYLVDRQSGKALTITLWKSEEALRASEEEANRLRSESAESASATIENVERYEVGISEASSSGPVTGVTDTAGGVTDTVGGTVGGATDSVRGVTDNLLGGQEKQR
jgi:heme-degrading monooxygenase HmoA